MTDEELYDQDGWLQEIITLLIWMAIFWAAI